MSSVDSAALPAETLALLQVLAFLRLQNGNARDAMALLQACDRAGGCRGRSLVLLALAQLRAGAPSQALSTLERADPGQPSHPIVRAQALSALGRHAEARQAMRAYAAARAAAKP